MNHFTFSAACLFFSGIIPTLYFLFKKDKLARIFGIYWLSIFYWSSTVAFQRFFLNKMPDFLWGWLLHFGCIFIPCLFFHFCVRYSKGNTKLIIVSYVVSVAYVLLNTFSTVFTHTIVYRDFYAYPKPASLYPIYFFSFVLMIIMGSFLLIREKIRLKNVNFAFILFVVFHLFAYTGAMDNFMIMYDLRIPPFYPYGLYAASLYAFVSTVAYRASFET